MVTWLSWPVLLGLTVAVFTGLFFLQRTFYRYIPRGFQIADLLPPVILLNIHVLSSATTGWSAVPYLMLSWLTLLLAYVIYRGFWKMTFTVKGVLLTYWRFTIIVLPVIYLIFLVVKVMGML